MNYFNPADLQQKDVTFNYIAKSGIGFALTPDNEQVFIPARDVDRLGLEVGDALRIWAVDNHAKADTAHYASRWRAVRVEIMLRMKDAVRAVPNTSAAKPKEPAQIDFVGIMDKVIAEPRPWTVNEMTHAVSKLSVHLGMQPDLLQRVSTRLNSLHKNGDVACLKVYAKSDNDRASAVYYAKNVDVFYEHLDTPINEDDEE